MNDKPLLSSKPAALTDWDVVTVLDKLADAKAKAFALKLAIDGVVSGEDQDVLEGLHSIAFDLIRHLRELHDDLAAKREGQKSP